MPSKDFLLEIKHIAPEGTFLGLASTSDLDQGGDVCLPGCFAATLKEKGPQRPLLADHSQPIGVVSLKETDAGLECKGALTMEVQKAREYHALMRDGAVRGLSIGFQVPPGGSEMRSDGVRVLKSIRLFEVSAVTFPMNERAMVASVKSAQQEHQIQTALDQFRREVLKALTQE